MKLNMVREQVDRLGRPSIEMLDREIARRERGEAYWRLTRGLFVSLLAAAALVVIVTNLWLNVLQIDGSSMNPLLDMNDVVIAVKDGNPAKNDVIAFLRNNKLHVKRVIATAGDRVEITDDGLVLVNGTVLSEPYVAEKSLGHCDIHFPFQVPPGAVFVLGDNRPSSLDSRDSGFGPVEREQVVGKVIGRMWPLPRLGRVS